MLKIFHTGDIHLGMRFNSYSENARKKLVEARYNSLENMINKSNDMDTDIFVIAGDLFNTVTVAKKDIERTVSILERFNGNCVLVLPGNHDYDNGSTELWKVFNSNPSEKIIFINEERKYYLDEYDINAVIYPAPCHNKHSSENSLGWIKEIDHWGDDKYHIGIAHGALEGLSADIEGVYYYMTKDELEEIPVDVWLLGHTHVQYPIGDEIQNNKIYNAGTPEPDGLNFRDIGSAWHITLDKEGVNSRRVETSEFRFIDKEFNIESEDDLEKLEKLALQDDPDKKVLRLNLKGNISEDIYNNLSEFYSDLDRKIFSLIIVDDELGIRVDDDVIQREFTKGSFPYEFLNSLKDDEEALQIAYELIRRE